MYSIDDVDKLIDDLADNKEELLPTKERIEYLNRLAGEGDYFSKRVEQILKVRKKSNR